MDKTLPLPRKPEGKKLDSKDLAAGRYGTYEMVQIWGPERTFEYSLRAQAEAVATLSELHPDIVPEDHAITITSLATIGHINPERIREIEEKTGHDVIAINTALEEKVRDSAVPEASSHINKFRTSADTTETAKAIQLQRSLEVIAKSTENLRDILIEKSVEWIDVPHMDTTHLYDATPTVAGRPFAHYVELLQSGLELIKHFHSLSAVGKWADATGNHHAATTGGIDGLALQEAYCSRLGIAHSIAPAQVPGLEFQADIIYSLARLGGTLGNIARYIAAGRGDDMNIFTYNSPKKKKGSSAMPHKDIKNGNPTTEEQVISIQRYLAGVLTTAIGNIEMPYARNLSASANMRIALEDGFKFLDHGIRSLAEVAYWLGLNKERCAERVNRSYGVVTAEQIMTYLTDGRYVHEPMGRQEAHELVAELASRAYNTKRQFFDVLATDAQIGGRINLDKLKELSDPAQFVGQSRQIIHSIAGLYHKKKTFE